MNDANLAALGQCSLTSYSKENLILLYFTEGIGLGIVKDGAVFTGATGYAGEIGTIRLSPKEENFTLERFLNLDGILLNYKEYALSGELLDGPIIDPITSEERKKLFKTLLSALNKKQVLEREFIRLIGRRLGWVVATLVDLFNPDTVYFGGDISPLSLYLLPHIRSYVRQYSLISQLTEVPIKAASVGNLIVKGMGELVFNHWITQTYSLSV